MKTEGGRSLLGLIALLICMNFNACSRAHGNHLDDQKDQEDQEDAKKPVDKFEWHALTYDSTKKYIYLSFDDGPQHGTVTCYDLCKKENVKASFFMVGLHTAQKSDGNQIVAMIRNDYPNFLLGNHSYTHANGKYLAFYHHPLLAENDFFEAQQTLHVPYKIVRLPGNRAWVRDGEIKATELVRPVAQLLDSAGYNVIGWDAEWHFNKKSARPVQSATKMANEIDSSFARSETHVHNHLVLLSHDRMFQHPDEADSLAKLIHILKQNPQYVFETVDHYPGLKKPVHKSE
ncbi:MAG: polysaccharide deacetylase family protein [Sediminibacterium sp.]